MLPNNRRPDRLPAAGRRTRGFTLIELVVAVAIVAVLAGMASPLLAMTAKRQKEAELRTALRQIRTAIDAYHQAVLDKRIAAPTGASGYPPNLAVLVDGVADTSSAKDKKIYFLRRLPRDPFYPGTESDSAETWGLRSYESPPSNPEPGDDVFDIHSLSRGTGLDGVPYKDW